MERLTLYLVTVYYFQGGEEVCTFTDKEEAQEYATERRIDDLYVRKTTVEKREV